MTASGWRFSRIVIPPIGICAAATRNAPSAPSRAQRESSGRRREASQVTRVSTIPASATIAVAELDERVEALLRDTACCRTGASCRSRGPSPSAARTPRR